MIVFGAFWFQRRLAPRYARMREAAGTLSARLANNLGGLATIQAYTAERFEAEQLAAASAAYRARNIAAMRFSVDIKIGRAPSKSQSLLRISCAVFLLKKKIPHILIRDIFTQPH